MLVLSLLAKQLYAKVCKHYWNAASGSWPCFELEERGNMQLNIWEQAYNTATCQKHRHPLRPHSLLS